MPSFRPVLLALLLVWSCTSRDVDRVSSRFPAVAAQLEGPRFVRTPEGFTAPGVTLPSSGEDALRFTPRPGVTVSVIEEGMTGLARADDDAPLSYARPDGRSHFTGTSAGLEEWVEVEHATGEAVASWNIVGAVMRHDEGGAVLMLVGDQPVLRVAAPFAVDRSGERFRAWLGFSGQRLSLFTDARGHVLVDPSWTAVSGPLARFQHTATLLRNGRVLLVGGRTVSGAGALRTQAELSDPTALTWAPVASPTITRYLHTATLLRSGRVLIVGGDTSTTVTPSPSNRAEIYNPATNTWTLVTATLGAARYRHTATLLDDGRVLIAGGRGSSDTAIASVEVFTENVATPAMSTFAAGNPLSGPRDVHTATLLPDGDVLVAGGGSAIGETWRPTTGVWSPTSNGLNTNRFLHAANLLPDGRVLLSGGNNPVGGALIGSTEFYDPATRAFSVGPSTAARSVHASTLLPDGRLLLVGGTSNCLLGACTQLFDPADGGLTPLGTVNRSWAGATVLPSSKVLITGGVDGTTVLASAELVSHRTPAWVAAAPLNVARSETTTTTLANGDVLVAGGSVVLTPTTTTERYLADAGTWVTTGPMPVATTAHVATLLNDGRVFTHSPVGAALYDPETGTWTTTTSVTAPRDQAAILLLDGRVLVVGGSSGSTPSTFSQIYDPATDAWAATGAPVVARIKPRLSLLANGRVVMTGGLIGTSTATPAAEVFNPATNQWTAVAPMANARRNHTSVTMANDQVLVVGGQSDAGLVSELFDGTSWTSAALTSVPRSSHAATLLRDGTVLVVGGIGPVSPTIHTQAEVFEVASVAGSGRGVFQLSATQNTGTIDLTLSRQPNGDVLAVSGLILGGPSARVDRYVWQADAVALQPVVTGVPTLVSPGTTFTITGANFTGLSDATGGTTTSSSANVPFVEVERIATGNRLVGSLGAIGPTSLVVDGGFPMGLYWLRVTNHGASSRAVVLPVFPPIAIAPLSATVPPRGQASFVGSGSAGSGYAWSLSPNLSGGSVDGGLYLAGSVGSVTDTVRVRDRFGNDAPATVTVGPGVSIMPAIASVPPRGALSLTASGGSNAGFGWSLPSSPSGGSIDGGAYRAGTTGNVTDVVQAVDSLGNVGQRNVNVTAGVSISPSNPTVAPRAPQAFSAMGGSGTGFTWALITNNSGATFDGGPQGYVAGVTPSVSDTLRVTDSLGNTATATISVGAALTVSPPSVSVVPRQARTFVAVNGVGPFTWSPATTPSGGSVSGLPDGGGAYAAGAMGGVTDTVRVTDAVGNMATATVTVGPGVSLSPSSGSVPPRGQLVFTAQGGSDAGFVWSMASSAGGSVDDAGLYRAAPTGNVVEAVRVTDSLGNIATAAITVAGGVVVSPDTVTVAPGSSVVFGARGGSDAGFTWSLATNASDGGVGALSGVYRAGSIGSRLDVVQAADSLGNTGTATVTVSAGVSISPQTAATPPLGTIPFTATGGVGAPYVWSLTANPSGGSVNAAGLYTAGAIEAVDTLRATDGNGNVATVQITVTNALTITPSLVTLPPRDSLAFRATGGSMTGFTWALVTNNSGASFDGGTGFYVAGATGSVTDSIRVTDSLGATAMATITIGPGVTVAPATITVTPRGPQRFTASGGRNTTFTWALTTNASGGTIAPTTGDYVAGPTGNVMDVVQATDTLGNVGIATVSVSEGVRIMPAPISLPPRGVTTFTAAGGTNMSFTWSMVARPSGGAIDPFTGQYTAGATGSVTDVVQARDSAGNVATVDVQVTAAVAVMPANPSVGPRGALSFTASGGADGGYRWAIRTNLSGATIGMTSGQYTAGAAGNVIDVVEATDVLGNQGITNVQVLGSLSLLPMQANQAPRSARTFQVVGGEAPFTWSLPTNGSGGSVDGGSYTAGTTGGVTDVVMVTDNAGNMASATVQVTAGVTVSPSTASVGPNGTQTFTAAGGSGEGFTWRLRTNASQGSIDAMGLYVAGGESGSDVVEASDSLGNTGVATVLVVPGATGSTTPFSQRPPISGWSCGCNTGGLDASVVLGAVLLLVGRRRRHRTTGRSRSSWVVPLVCLVVATGVQAAPSKKARPKNEPKAPAPVVTPAPEVTPAAPPVAPPAAPAPRKADKPSLAVLDVEVTVPNEKLDAAAFSELLVSAADGPAMFRVISSKDITTMLGLERQRQLMGCNEDTSCMTEIANALGAEFVLVGTVGKVGENYLVSARLIDGLASRVVGRGSVQATDPNLLLSALWSATGQALDTWGAGLSGAEAQRWANRARPAPPAAMVVSKPLESSFGATVGAVGGYQVLSVPGQRGSIGLQVDGTWRLSRFDLALGLIIGPNLGARVTATWALVASRFRLMAGLRGSGYPGLVAYGGGPVVAAEFAFTPWLAASASGGSDFYPTASGLVVVLLASAGVAMHF